MAPRIRSIATEGTSTPTTSATGPRVTTDRPARYTRPAKSVTIASSAARAQPVPTSAPRASEATARKFNGVSNVAITIRPSAVVGSFQRRSAWKPSVNSKAVTPLNRPNFKIGRSAMLAQKLMTRASEQPTISKPPTSSPQRMFFSSKNAASRSSTLRDRPPTPAGSASFGSVANGSATTGPTSGPFGSRNAISSRAAGFTTSAAAATGSGARRRGAGPGTSAGASRGVATIGRASCSRSRSSAVNRPRR